MKAKKIISMLLAFIMIFTAANPAFAAFFESQDLQVDEGLRAQLLTCNGASGSVGWNNFAPTMVNWTHPDTGKLYYAYCVNPALEGQGDNGLYPMNLEKMLDDTAVVDAGGSGGSGKSGQKVVDYIWGAITYGFPNKTAAELGVKDDYAAYYATKMAIWALIHDSYSNLNNWSAYVPTAGERYSTDDLDDVLEAMKQIVTQAKSYDSGQRGSVSATVTAVGTMQETGGEFVQEYKVEVSGATGDRYYVTLGANTANAVLTDASGTTKTNTDAFAVNDTFKIKAPIPASLPYDIAAEFTIKVITDAPVCVYAEPSDPSLKNRRQNYVFYGQGATGLSGSFQASDKPGDVEESGDWTIYKLDAKTGKPIPHVTFDIYNNAGQLIDSGTTGSDGIYVPKIKKHDVSYTVIERTTNPDYQLTEPTTQVVFVESAKKTTTYFRDFQKQTVEGHKVDATTGIGISGVQFQITQVDGKGAWKAVTETDKDGRFSWENVPDGTYTVHEVSTTTGYILDSTPQVVTVRNGMAPSLKFTNSKFPGLTITKIDKQTGAVISSPATFHVEQIDGTYTADVTTTGGTINLKDIPVGTYKITEKSAPEGYVIDPECGTVYLGKGESKQYIAYDLKKPVLTIEKIDGQTGKSIPGVKFEIKKTDGAIFGIVETGADGTVTVGLPKSALGYLDPGTYTVTETFVPEPHVLPTDGSQVKNIALNAGDTKSLLFTDLEMPTITVEKYDEKTGAKLPGAQFAIYEQSDTSRPVVEGMTDAQGKFTSGYIMPGTYVVKELLPPPGYMLSDKTQSERVIVAKAGDGVITVKVDNILLPKLIIKKLDAVTKEPIAGVTFKVTQTDDTSFQPATAVTNSQGIIEIPGLKAGTYTVTEISVPSNYILDSTPQNVKMEAGDTKTLLFENTQLPTLVITKTDYSTNNPVPDTTFKVEYENTTGGTELIGTYRTDSDGRIVLPFVRSGWYVLTETIPAQGMQLPSNPVTRIYLNPGANSYTDTSGGNVGGNSKSYTVTSGFDYPNIAGVVNYPLNSIVIKKADANTGEMLSGATFEIIRTSGETSGQNGTVIGTVTTDASGVIVFTGLEGGTYTVKETLAPQNYIIAETSLQTVTMKADGTSILEVTFRNYPFGSLLISKIDGVTGEPLFGARFKVTDASGAAVGNTTGEFTTDSSGEILIENVAPGSYVLTEIQAPANYVVNTTPKTVHIGTDGKTYKASFDNYPYGSLLITKIDALTGEPLAGATFKVIDNSGKVVGNTTGEFTTDSRGEILIEDVAPGSYVVTEIKAPENYAINSTPKPVEVGTDGKTYKLSFDNYPYGTLVIKKLDTDTKEPLAGAEFKVTTSKGDAVGTGNGYYTTDATGTIAIPNLPKDSYIIEETKAPKGFILENQTKTIAIDYGKSYTLEFFNKKMSSLQIVKLDAQTKQPLKDAKFNIYKMNGELLGQYTTDSQGLIIMDTLESGWYKVSEYQAPDGYLLDNTPQDVEIVGNQFVKLVFENHPKASLIIKKFDAATKEPLMGAKFKVTKKSGELIGEYTTNANGMIQIDKLNPGWYSATEITAPEGYKIYDMAQDFEIVHTKTVTLEFPNQRLTSLIIKKIDDKMGKPLSGAKFYVERQNGLHVGEYTTDADGLVNIPTLTPDWYVIREVKSPDGYLLDETPKTVEVKTDVPTVITFSNKKLTALEIKKVDELSGAPLPGAKFAVEKQNGERIGEYTTDNTGLISIPTLDPDWYVVRETKAPSGYLLDETPKIVEVKTTAPTVVTFTNKKLTALEIIKVDELSNVPLNGAVFAVERQNGERIGEYTTTDKGVILIPELAPDWYIVKEIKAPQGYLLDENPQTVEVKTDSPTVVKFTNKKLTALEIIKTDDKSGEPLSGAKFVVERQNGERIGEYTTSEKGIISIPALQPDWYVVKEIKAPDGYVLDESPRTVEVKTDVPTTVKFTNRKMTSLQIKKVDGVTGAPLAGARFTVEKQNGEKIYTNENGTEFTTDAQGFISIPTLAPDYYVIKEVKAPEGYIIDETPKTVEVKTDAPTTVTFSNQPLAGLKVIKLNAQTKTPVEGAEFAIAKMDGQKVQNGSMGYTFKTDSTGTIYIPNLHAGHYMVTETKAPAGFLLDGEPKTVEVKSGQPTIIEVLNSPASGLLIVKTDSNTGKPLKGVVFDVRKADGQRVQSSILDANQPNTPNNSPNKSTTPNGDISGSYTTDSNGRILINHLEPGEYHVVEMRALNGYVLDTDVHSVTVVPGKQAVLQLQNTPMAGLRIHKIDSVTKKGIYNVEFRVYDFETNKEVGGPFYSDNNGVVDFTGILSAGRYKIIETRPAEGYLRDDMPKTIEFKAGKITEVTWENTAYMGQIQIVKKSADDNQLNGLPKGTPLANAVFEVYQYRTGNVVDQFTTGSDGRGASKPLPVGRYLVKEVKAPSYYKISDQVLDVEIEFSSQILKYEFTNESANLGVAIKKVGPVETMPGQQIKYEFKTIRNQSTVPLSDFFFRDIIPVNAVKLDKLITGTYNQSLRYKIMYKTNKNDYRVMADNLSTTSNNAIDASAASLGLYSDEYITEIMFVFGTVKAGFCQVENPYIFCTVKSNVTNISEFANKADIGGKHNGEWIIGSTSWVTKIFHKKPAVLPRTGY